MKITILVDDEPLTAIVHDDAVFAFSLAHRVLVEAQADAARMVDIIEAAPAPAPAAAPTRATPTE